MAEKGFLLAGDIFVETYNPTTGLYAAAKIVETEEFAIGTPSDLEQALSRGRNTYNQAHTSVPVPKPVDFNATFTEAGIEIMAMMLSGITEAINLTQQTLTDEVVTVVLDGWVDIGFTNLNMTGLTVTNTAGTTTYVLGTDYEINPRLGMIRALSTGDITAGDVHVSGSTVATTGTRIIGARQYKHQMRLRMDGINLVNRQDIVLFAPQATVSSQDAYDFLGGKLAKPKLKGLFEIAEGWDRPFHMDYIDAPAA